MYNFALELKLELKILTPERSNSLWGANENVS